MKGGDGPLKDRDRDALAELERLGLATGEAYKIKEKLRWVRKAATPQAARWRLTRFLNHADEMAAGDDALAPVRKAIATVRQQIDRIIQRWYSTHSNARLEGLNSIFQAARHRARGYSSAATFIAMIYLLAARSAISRNPFDASERRKILSDQQPEPPRVAAELRVPGPQDERTC